MAVTRPLSCSACGRLSSRKFDAISRDLTVGGFHPLSATPDDPNGQKTSLLGRPRCCSPLWSDELLWTIHNGRARSE